MSQLALCPNLLSPQREHAGVKGEVCDLECLSKTAARVRLERKPAPGTDRIEHTRRAAAAAVEQLFSVHCGKEDSKIAVRALPHVALRRAGSAGAWCPESRSGGVRRHSSHHETMPLPIYRAISQGWENIQALMKSTGLVVAPLALRDALQVSTRILGGRERLSHLS